MDAPRRKSDRKPTAADTDRQAVGYAPGLPVSIFWRRVPYPDEATLRTSNSSSGQMRRSGVSSSP